MNERKEKLYHYTTAQSALKILCSGKFRFGHRENQNDPFENFYCRYSYPRSSELSPQVYDYLWNLSEYANKQLSIASFGTELESGNGYYKPTMWAHYAENHKGVCFVFEKDSLINEVNKLCLEPIIKRVDYDTPLIISEIEIEKYLGDPYNSFIKRFQDNLLFAKLQDWSIENETRIVVFQDKFEIPISNCLNKVVLGPKMSNEDEEVFLSFGEKTQIFQLIGRSHFSFPTLAYPFKFFFLD